MPFFVLLVYSFCRKLTLVLKNEIFRVNLCPDRSWILKPGINKEENSSSSNPTSNSNPSPNQRVYVLKEAKDFWKVYKAQNILFLSGNIFTTMASGSSLGDSKRKVAILIPIAKYQMTMIGLVRNLILLSFSIHF